MKRLIIYLFAITVMASCSKSIDAELQNSDSAAVQLSGGTVVSRLNDEGTMWSLGDAICVSLITADDMAYMSEDVKYTATQDNSVTSAFVIASGYSPIYYPTGRDVIFHAYRGENSFAASLEDGARFVVSDISDQSDFSSIEVLIADPVSVDWDGGANVDVPVSLEFSHKLSKVVFNVTCNESLGNYIELVGNINAYFTDVCSLGAYNVDGGLYEGAQCMHFSTVDTMYIKSIALDTVFTTTTSGSNRPGGNSTTTTTASATSGTMMALLHPAEYYEAETGVYNGYQNTKLNIEIYVDGGLQTLQTDFCPEYLDCGYTYSYDVTIGRSYINIDTESFKIIGWNDVEESPIESEFSFQGYGTTDNPFVIVTAADMFKIGVDEDYPLDACYKLFGDIDLNSEKWTPIGTESEMFTGVFDGAGYSIKGLNLERNESGLGLFGYVGAEGVVKNISVYGAVGSSSTSGTFDFYDSAYYLRYIAAVVAYNCGSVINCHNYAEVNCGSTNLRVDAAHRIQMIGGVVGYNGGGTIAYCSNNSTITVSGTNTASSIYGIGGVVAYSYASASNIVNCYNNADIITNTSSTGGSAVGGVAGYAGVTNIANCYNSGTVTGYTTVGGLVGYASFNCCFYACYNVGDVNGVSNTYSNGFYGNGSSATYTRCYTASDATGYISSNEGSITGVTMASFVDYFPGLNIGADSYNATSPEIEAAEWSAGSGDYIYPIFDMSNASSY